MPNGYPRLFDTEQAVDDKTGYGTSDLAGDYGNVLIIQQTGGNEQWKANELGGIISFEFSTPVDEVVEIGLLNVEEDVWVQVTDSEESVRSFKISADTKTPTKNIVLNVMIKLWSVPNAIQRFALIAV